MSKVMGALKDEICRLSRKEIRSAVAGLNRDRKVLKKDVAGLKKQMAALLKGIKELDKTVAMTAAAIPKPAVDEGKKGRVTGKGIRSLRRKLKLSQAEFGKLLGISGGAVLNMEKKSGPMKKMRAKTRSAYLAIRGISVKEARERLGMK